jgi:hypothetical protein
MLKTIGIILVLVLAWSIIKTERRAAPQPALQVATIQDKQLSAAKSNVDLNRGLPVMLDSQTMLTKVEASTESTIYYIKMMNYPSEYIDPAFLVKAQELIGQRNCANTDIKWSFDQGMHFKYIVSGSDNKPAGSFIVSKIYCQRFR